MCLLLVWCLTSVVPAEGRQQGRSGMTAWSHSLRYSHSPRRDTPWPPSRHHDPAVMPPHHRSRLRGPSAHEQARRCLPATGTAISQESVQLRIQRTTPRWWNLASSKSGYGFVRGRTRRSGRRWESRRRAAGDRMDGWGRACSTGITKLQ